MLLNKKYIFMFFMFVSFSLIAESEQSFIALAKKNSSQKSINEKRKITSLPKSWLNITKLDLECLAKTIHGEARGETSKGRVAVGRVILTRLQRGFGDSVCEVTTAPRQFAPAKKYSEASMLAARKAIRLGPSGITHFHSYKNQISLNENFSKRCSKKGRIDNHWFFTCPRVLRFLASKKVIKSKKQVAFNDAK